jgi:superfamily II DNA or RNA helicase
MNVLAVMPTGSGKTVLFTRIVADRTSPACILVHRVELVSQISVTLARWGVRHRIIAPGPTVRSIRYEHFHTLGKHYDHPQSIHSVASVDTLLSRADRYTDYLRQVRLWIVDEAAHVLSDNKWGRCTTLFGPLASGLGFTATPRRADGKGLSRASDGVFDMLIEGPSTAELIVAGYLSPYKIIAKPSDMDVADLRATASGDYGGQALRLRSAQSHIVGDVVKEYKRHADGKQGLTFTVDVQTANQLAHEFRQAGVPAAAVSAKTPEAERQRAVRDFRDGKLKQLTNCDLFGEGFDVPGVEVVSLARPTMSLALHLQQIGRSLRPAPGKDHALIIDHVGNWERHGLPDSPRNWTLEPREKRIKRPIDPDVVPLTTCTECFLVFPRARLPVCPHCGATREPGERRRPEQVDGDLTLIDEETLAQLRQSTDLETPDQIRNKVLHSTRNKAAAIAAERQRRERIASQERLQAAIALWAGTGRAQGIDDATLYRRFYARYGVDVLSAQALPRAEMDALRERIENVNA